MVPIMASFPVPGAGVSAVAVPPPAPGEGNWVGAPSAALSDDVGFVVAYRVRTANRRGSEIVIAESRDGERLTTVARLDKDRLRAESLERPALVRAGTERWRLYVSCATPGTKHWRIDALDAVRPAELQDSDAQTVFRGDDRVGVKDPVIRHASDGWHAWICCHALDVPGEEDRMYTRYATSPDGLAWQWQALALMGRPGAWDARAARVTAVLPDGRAAYDGRATKEENFSERTGLATLAGARGCLVPAGATPVADARYLDVLPLPGGGFRIYYEAPLPDGSHELRTEIFRHTS